MAGTWNIPNQITVARLVLSVVLFVLLPLQLYLASLILFVIAAGTDWVDGYLARKWKQVTQLGRILDPFADKIIICGTFIFLCAEYPASGIAPWMVVVIVGREFLVTVLRSYFEQQGTDFSAKMAGKLKMWFQCIAAVASMLALVYFTSETKAIPEWLQWTVFVSAWLAVISTIYSGLEYVFVAVKLLGKPA